MFDSHTIYFVFQVIIKNEILAIYFEELLSLKKHLSDLGVPFAHKKGYPSLAAIGCPARIITTKSVPSHKGEFYHYYFSVISEAKNC